MLFLQIPLLAALLGGGANEDAFEDHIFRTIFISSVYNHSWAQASVSGWLGEFQTFSWNSNSAGFIYPRPWSKGNFSNKQLTKNEELFQRLYAGLQYLFHSHASRWMFEYPLEVQGTIGCELNSGEVKLDLVRAAHQGSELLSFPNNTCLPSPEGGTRAQRICRVINHYTVAKQLLFRALSDDCPRYLLSALAAGKADLQRKVKPEAWLSIGPNPGSSHLLLVCHVSGFHPKPISVMWMRGEQALQGSQQSDILPNADGTWYLQISLDVEATETSGLSCWVRHSSLEGQDIILYLDRPNSKGLIVLAVMVPLVLLLTGLAFWLKKRRTHSETPPIPLPLE